MATFPAPTNEPSPLSPLVPLNSPMVGTASPFGQADGQNRDIILEAIRTWAAQNLLTWSSAWQTFFTGWIQNVDDYITGNALTGFSWRTTTTPITPTGNTNVTIALSTAPLRLGDLVADQTADTNYGIIVALIDSTHATVSYLGYLHGLQGTNVAPADTAVAGFINTAGTQTRIAGDGRYVQRDTLTINVRDHGATGNGTTDDTAAIQAAINLAPFGGNVLIPRGQYLISTLTVNAGINIQGMGFYGTVLISSVLTGDVVTMNSASSIRSVSISATATRTAGAHIKISGAQVKIDQCSFNKYFVGVMVGDAANKAISSRIADCTFAGDAAATTADSGGIYLFNISDPRIIDCDILGNSNTFQPLFGIRVREGDTWTISKTSCVAHGYGLLIDPPAGKSTFSGYVAQCLFDSPYNAAGATSPDSARIVPAATGFAHDITFNGVWFGNAAPALGVGLDAIGTGGGVYGIHVTGCQAFDNDTGMRFNGVTDFEVTGCATTGNTNYGIGVGAACKNFVITGNRSGADQTHGTQAYGINVDASAHTNYVITSNNLTANTSVGLYEATTGTPNKVVANNLS